MSKSQDRKRTRMFDKKAKRGDAQAEPILKVWPQEPWGENLDDELDPSPFEPDAKPAPKPQPMNVDAPDWLEGYLKYQSEFTRQLADQIVEDHQVLIDHGWRLHDIEEYLGMASSEKPKPEPEPEPEPQVKAEPKSAPQPEPKPQAKAEPKPAPQSEPKSQQKAQPKPEPQPEPKVKAKAKAQPQPQQKAQPEPQSQQKAQPEPQPQVGLRQGLAPREMYEAECFDGGKWRLYGPFKRISQAEQITMDLNRVNIVWVWWDYKKDIPCGYLTADDMVRYL